jgi:alkaline phosphatase
MTNLGSLGRIVLLGIIIGGLGGAAAPVRLADTAGIAASASRTPGAAQARNRSGSERSPVLLAAGDIADCQSHGDQATAALIRTLAGTIATLGDNAYPAGSRQQFAACYGSTWGAEKWRTKPAPGNHEYETRGARGSFAYFGAAAGQRGQGYYSYDLGAWHVIVLNSNCDEIGGCGTGSAQGKWLRADLAAHPAACTLAYWHHPLFSSGKEHGGDAAMRPAWQLLYAAGADVVLAGHEHNYERFAPQDPNGRPDPERGIREFVVGTGGEGHYQFGKPFPTSEARNAETFGVLALTLRPRGYEWTFVPAGARRGTPGAFADTGRSVCH